MTLNETMDELRQLGNEKVREQNAKNGAGDNQFGVKSGDLRTLAKRIKTNPELVAALWQTGNSDAMRLATLLMKPHQTSPEELETMVNSVSVTDTHLADWLGTHVVKLHPQKESLRQKWMESSNTNSNYSSGAEALVKDVVK